MAGKLKDGSRSILQAAEELCRLWNKYGEAPKLFAQSPALKTAVSLVAAACAVLKGLDDQPLTIDTTVPLGPEDVEGGSTEGPF